MREYPEKWNMLVASLCHEDHVDPRFGALLIAIACLESNYGQSELAREACNLLSIRVVGEHQGRWKTSAWRMFLLDLDCFRSGLYLMLDSNHYVAPREQFRQDNDMLLFIQGFGAVYCPDREVAGQHRIWTTNVRKLYLQVVNEISFQEAAYGFGE